MIETVYSIAGAPRIALLTDLHNHSFSAVISSLQTHRSSMIAIAGDIVSGRFPEDGRSPSKAHENVIPFFSACTAIAPTFFSLGNHEQFLDHRDLKAISNLGVIVLNNKWINRRSHVRCSKHIQTASEAGQTIPQTRREDRRNCA